MERVQGADAGARAAAEGAGGGRDAGILPPASTERPGGDAFDICVVWASVWTGAEVPAAVEARSTAALGAGFRGVQRDSGDLLRRAEHRKTVARSAAGVHAGNRED